MSKRRKKGRGPTPAKCERCGDRATHFVNDPYGETITSCGPCFLLLAMAIRSLGGNLAGCECWECIGVAAYVNGVGPVSGAGRGGRPQAEPRPGARPARAAADASNLRGPV
jgi:hypothetical protein